MLDGGTIVDRLTNAEFDAIYSSTDINVRRWIESLRMAGFLVLSDSKLTTIKSYLVSHGLLTQVRADEIFAEST